MDFLKIFAKIGLKQKKTSQSSFTYWKLAKKFQLKLTILNFFTKLTQKRVFPI